MLEKEGISSGVSHISMGAKDTVFVEYSTETEATEAYEVLKQRMFDSNVKVGWKVHVRWKNERGEGRDFEVRGGEQEVLRLVNECEALIQRQHRGEMKRWTFSNAPRVGVRIASQRITG